MSCEARLSLMSWCTSVPSFSVDMMGWDSTCQSVALVLATATRQGGGYGWVARREGVSWGIFWHGKVEGYMNDGAIELQQVPQ